MSRILSRKLSQIERPAVVANLRNPEMFFVDLRLRDQMKGGRIPALNWINIPIHELDDFFNSNTLDNCAEFARRFDAPAPTAEQTIVFYCLCGVEARPAAALWENRMQNREVMYYQGGWFDWNEDWEWKEWKKWILDVKFGRALLSDEFLKKLG